MYCAIAEHIYSAKNQWVKCALASLLAFGLWPTSSAYADSPGLQTQVLPDGGQSDERPLEGPENSWRYESGERVLSHVPAITTFGAEPGYDTYVTWTRANGP